MKFVIQYSTVGDDQQFYLNPCRIQDALKAVGNERPITSLSFEFNENIELNDDTVRHIKSVDALNKYLDEAKDFTFKYITVEFDNDLTLRSEKEQEVIFQMPKGSSDEAIVSKLVSEAGLNPQVIKGAEDLKGKYCVFDSNNSQLVEQVDSFQELSQ